MKNLKDSYIKKFRSFDSSQKTGFFGSILKNPLHSTIFNEGGHNPFSRKLPAITYTNKYMSESPGKKILEKKT